MERSELTLLLSRTTAAGAMQALKNCGDQPQAITRSQAYRLYGRSDVDRWLSEKLLNPTITNRLDRIALAQVAARSNRTTYLPVAER